MRRISGEESFFLFVSSRLLDLYILTHVIHTEDKDKIIIIIIIPCDFFTPDLADGLSLESE